MKTYAYCELCRWLDAVEHEEHIDVMGGFYAVADAHHAASPSCEVSDYRLRVVNFSHILKEHLPEWAVRPIVELVLDGEL